MWKVVFCCLIALASIAASAGQVGFQQITLAGSAARELKVALWYPTQAVGHEVMVGGNAAFIGAPVLPQAAPAPGQHPLLLLSHGYGGSWRNLNWLAQALAAQGYIVAAPDHPGTTTQNRNPAEAAKLWLRPDDIDRVLDKLLAAPALAGEADKARIAAIGHSLGGWTVMELAGAQFDAQQFITDCRQHPQLADCKLTATLGIDATQAQQKLAASQRNPHISAVVSLDLGLARGFTPASLAALPIPVLVLSADRDSTELPATLESGYLAHAIPSQRVTFARIPGATHFSFMQRCQPGARALIEADSPGDGIICQDETGFARQDIHQLVLQKIADFLSQTLDYRPRSAGTPSASSR